MARDIADVADLFDDDQVDEKSLCVAFPPRVLRRAEMSVNVDPHSIKAASRFDAIDYDDLSNPSVMSAFYRRLFPVKQIYTWLNQDHGQAQ